MLPHSRLALCSCFVFAFASAFACGSPQAGYPEDDAGTADEADGGAPTRDGSAALDAADARHVEAGAACVGKAGQRSRTVTLTSDGQSRSFDLHIPPSYDPAKRTPLVFVFHGYTMTAASIADATGFAAVADAHGMIVAFPSGLGGAFNAGDCCGGSQADDIAFTRDMITALTNEYCVDDKRIFSAGFSNGGYFSYRLACEMSDQIAAIAPVAGVLGVSPCAPKRPVPVLHIHGTGDVVVPYAGGGIALARSAAGSVGVFETADACSAGDGQVVYTKGDVSCRSWGPCGAGSDVQLCTVSGGGHQWPGGKLLPYGGAPSPNLVASEAIASFFDAHPMP